MKALGMIEVYGYVAAVEALDSALKAANVETVEVRLVQGGLVAVFVTGDVGATKAAVAAAASSASRVGQVISTHVIPRPAGDIERLFGEKKGNDVPPDNGSPTALREICEIQEESDEEALLEEMPEKAEQTEQAERSETAEPGADVEPEGDSAEYEVSAVCVVELSEEIIKGMTVADLRRTVRSLHLPGMTRKDIRFARKEELISAISAYLEQGGR